MNFQFYILLNLFLLMRLVFIKREKEYKTLNTKEFLFMMLIPIFFGILIYKWNLHVLWMIILVIVIVALQQLSELIVVYKIASTDRMKCSYGLRIIRIVSLLLVLFTTSIWVSEINLLVPRGFILKFAVWLKKSLLVSEMIQNVGFLKLNTLFFGILLIVNEMNIVFRFIFDILKISHPGYENTGISKESSDTVSEEAEYNNGRLIGILERIIIFFLIIRGKEQAIAFILAAKTFARSKKLENDYFAKYVLIGTLLSVLLSLLVAMFIKELL